MKATKRESNYRTLPTDIGDLALKRNYTPSAGDKHFLDRTVSRRWSHLAVAIHLMVFRNLGYFVPLARVPDRIRTHIASCLGLVRMPPPGTLEKYDTSGSKRTHIEALRAYLGVKPFRKESEAWLFDVALRAAETKHDVSDIISVLCEELVHHAYEIPAFDEVLKKTADRAQRQVTDQHLGRIATALTPATRKVIDELLTRRPGDILTGWQQLKREPHAPSPHEARAMLHHMQRLKHLADQMPAVDLPQPKLRAYRHWARALDATELSRLQPGRRYGLAVIYIHAQRGRAVDDIIEVFLRLMQNLDNTARRNLLAYQIQNSERADELIGQLRALLVAYQKKGSNRRRFLAMESALIRDALSLEEACDEHLAFAGKNYLPFLLKPYGSVRGQLLDCLEFAGIQSADDQSPTWHWLQRLLDKLRHMRKVEVTCAQLGVDPSDLDWLTEFWPKQVLLGEDGGQTRLNRRFLELAIIFSVRDELKSGDLFVPKGEEHDDYRLHLVSDDVLDRELQAYGETTGIETDPKLLTRQLKQDLADAIKQVDGDFPENPYSRIVNGRLSIKKSPAETPNPAIKKLDLLVKDRLAPINIVDLLVDTCRWTNLHRQFRHLSGGAGRISDLLPPVVAMTFCYGFNLGPAQTERSLRGISRKQLAHLQLHYATDDHLDAANTTVINAFSRYQLTKFWGTGKTASADGTQWSMYEENLISTNHIRYGGYGGIGYYLVADNYIALMARFITCGAYEATYILDLLMNNVSDIQPDTVHGDTHAQNLPVFAMAFLLGIKLMPRIRQLWRVQFSRAQKQHRCKNLEPLFKDDVNWERIQTHMREMMRVAVSIKLGKLAPSDILRRLGSQSKKNSLYLAFRELGKVVRTMFLLSYVDDVKLRQAIQSATNKSEQFNRFLEWVFFAGEGIIAENVRHQQQKIIKFSHLAANLVMLHNVDQLTRVFAELQRDGVELTPELLGAFSPYQMAHINRLGDYTLDLSRKPPKTNDDFVFEALAAPGE